MPLLLTPIVPTNDTSRKFVCLLVCLLALERINQQHGWLGNGKFVKTIKSTYTNHSRPSRNELDAGLQFVSLALVIFVVEIAVQKTKSNKQTIEKSIFIFSALNQAKQLLLHHHHHRNSKEKCPIHLLVVTNSPPWPKGNRLRHPRPPQLLLQQLNHHHHLLPMPFQFQPPFNHLLHHLPQRRRHNLLSSPML